MRFSPVAVAVVLGCSFTVNSSLAARAAASDHSDDIRRNWTGSVTEFRRPAGDFFAMGDRDDFWDDAVKSLDNATITSSEGHN